MSKWYRIDNAGKLFPSTNKKENSSIFRIAVVMKNHVQKENLQRALDTILERFPMFKVRLKMGIFWWYLDENSNAAIVQEEIEYPCGKMNMANNNWYLFKVLYYKNRISLEVFHSITDATGAIEFMKSLIYYYLKYSGFDVSDEENILFAHENVKEHDHADSFLSHYTKNKASGENGALAYHINGTKYDIFGNNVISGIVSVAEIKSAGRKYSATITEFLSAVLVYSIFSTRMKYGINKDPIVVTVPVNLRNIFPSKTLRNFFGVINVAVYIEENETFNTIIDKVRKEFKAKLNKENLKNIFYSNVNIENYLHIKLVPLFIKNFFVNYGFETMGENKKTITMSNFGNVQLSKNISKYIDHFEGLVYPSTKSPVAVSFISIENELNISFIKNIKDTDFIEAFFKTLSIDNNIKVKVYSNNFGVK